MASRGSNSHAQPRTSKCRAASKAHSAPKPWPHRANCVSPPIRAAIASATGAEILEMRQTLFSDLRKERPGSCTVRTWEKMGGWGVRGVKGAHGWLHGPQLSKTRERADGPVVPPSPHSDIHKRARPPSRSSVPPSFPSKVLQ